MITRHININPLAKYTFEAIDALEKTDLEYTRVVNGWFLDYYGMPHWETSLHPWINILSMRDKWAVVPGDGTAEATFITTQDLGRFIGRLMDAPAWDHESTIVGNEMRFNDLLLLAEKIRGELSGPNAETLTRVLISNQAASSKSPMTVSGSWTPATSLSPTDSLILDWEAPRMMKRSLLGSIIWLALEITSWHQASERLMNSSLKSG